MRKELKRIIKLFESYSLTKEYRFRDIFICNNFSKPFYSSGRNLVFAHKYKIVSKYKMDCNSLWDVCGASNNNELNIVLQEKIDYLKYLLTVC